MFWYDNIRDSKISDEDKDKLTKFLKLLDSHENDKVNEMTYEELRAMFEIAKINPKLQIEMWCQLPEEVVNKPENLGIFEAVLENRFGEYIHGIDKKALVQILNGSRTWTRRN